MNLKKINPFPWIALTGYLLFMVAVYLKHDLPEFLDALGYFTMLIGGVGWLITGPGKGYYK